MFKYETHLHTWPVSACGRAEIREMLEFYKQMDYDGVFVTNHFLDGNINIDESLPYQTRLDFYFSDYEKGLELSDEIGIKVFLGIEISTWGTDFLIYGLDKDWFKEHPQVMDMKVSDKLVYMREHGGYIVHAHPFKEAPYIDHIRLYPRNVDAVEVINGRRPERENRFAEAYADSYNLAKTAGSDNHIASAQDILAGVMSETPVNNVQDYIRMIESGELKPFVFHNNANEE